MFDKFSARHIGTTDEQQVADMLEVIGVSSVDELISEVIPDNIRLEQPLELSEAMSEYELREHITQLADLNELGGRCGECVVVVCQPPDP